MNIKHRILKNTYLEYTLSFTLNIICERCGADYFVDEYKKDRFCRKCGSLLKISSYQSYNYGKLKIDDISDLGELIQRAVSSYKRSHDSSIPITSPSIPIVYFGDLPEYMRSGLKVITVGLNPSYHEFPSRNRFMRFPEAKDVNLSDNLSKNDANKIQKSYDNYYKIAPYNWFDSFEPILKGLDSSYFEGSYPNRVIHTDICSPFATDITWSNLDDRYTSILKKEGSQFWHKLVEIIKPDIMLISVAKKHLKEIRFSLGKWESCHSIGLKKDGTPRARQYIIETAEYETPEHKGKIFFGQAAQLPFGTLSDDIKFSAGQEIKKIVYK
jgi:ribosomal protein S27AE